MTEPGGGATDRRDAARRRRVRLAVTATVATVATVASLIVAVMLLPAGRVALEADPPAATPPAATPSAATPPATQPTDTTPPPAEEPLVAERPVPDVVTEDDDGTTFLMQPGGHTALRLSNDWLWDPPDVRGNALMLAEVAYFADPGYVEWHVEAVAPGAVEIVVQGAPNCGDEAACPPRSVTLSFVVEH